MGGVRSPLRWTTRCSVGCGNRAGTPHPARPLWLCLWRGGECGWAACGLRFVGQHAEVWDVETGRELRTLQGHSGYVSGVAVSADGRRAVSALRDNTLKRSEE